LARKKREAGPRLSVSICRCCVSLAEHARILTRHDSDKGGHGIWPLVQNTLRDRALGVEIMAFEHSPDLGHRVLVQRLEINHALVAPVRE